MRKMGVAGWWNWNRRYSGWLTSLEAVEEVEGGLALGGLALGCLGEEAVEVVEVGAGPTPLWCHSQSCGRGCRLAPPITQSPGKRERQGQN